MTDKLQCSRCGRHLPTSSFYRNSTIARGYKYACKTCDGRARSAARFAASDDELGEMSKIVLDVCKQGREFSQTLEDALRMVGYLVQQMARSDRVRKEPDMIRENSMRALEQCEWNVTRAAQMLGIGRATLFRRLKEWGVARRGGRLEAPERLKIRNYAFGEVVGWRE